jgi:5-hydroxyisourate hydrolase-like protein (transthyretin family)/peroxiredoxin
MKIKTLTETIVLLCLCVCGLSQAKETRKLPIEGQVIDYMARPVEGAEIAVYEKIYRNNEEFPKMIAPIIKTDHKGCFALQVDVSSQYGTFIVARKEGLALAWDGLNYSRNFKGKGHFLLVMEKPCTVAGIVVDHTGQTVSGAMIQALPKTSYMSRLSQRPILAPTEWFAVETDSEGKFEFDQFATDVSCDFWVKAPRLGSTYKFTTHYQNACGFEVWRSDIRLVLPQEGNIKGHVVEAKSGKPIGGVELAIQADRDREDILNRYCVRTITADANGAFECIGLPEGKNKIEFAEPENETAQWIAKPVEVNVAAGQASENVKLLLEKGELIECIVRENGSERPLDGVTVSVYGESGNARSLTDKTGTVQLRIPPGEYQAYASGEGYTSWRVNESVIVKAGEITHLDIPLDKTQMLKGSVVDADGQPAEDVLVTIHPFGDHVYTDQEGNFAAGYEEQRAGNGVFVMAGDPERSLAALVLTKEFKKPVELTLGPALTVKGQITDPNGAGIPAARVALCFHFTNCLSDMGAETLTDSSGYFTFDAIPPVNSDFDYRISVYAAGFGPKEYKRITIEGKPGTTTNVPSIQLTPADVSLSGIVVDANGLPAARVPIFLNGADGSDQPRKSTATNKEGRFELKRICKGPLRLQANFRSSPGGEGMLYAQGGNQDVKIILGQEGAHRPQVSLAGKPLPEMKDLGIKLSPVDIDDKKILICFFDMEQRPSRNCMIQLTKQAEQLKNENVTVIAVQASKIEQEALNQWVEKNNIPFPVGMVQGDTEKACFAWGVQSLPWLILTLNDSRHIVTSEGFGLGELDDKIKAVK